MKKILIGSVTVLALAIAGYLAYTQYSRRHFIESLTPHVKNASLRVSNSANYETEDSKITFGELFERLEADIAEVDKRLLEIQSLSSPATTAITDPTVVYLRASQDYLRALLQKYRKGLAMSSAVDRTNESLEELRSANSYGYEYAKRSLDQAQKNMLSAHKGYNESLPELVGTISKLSEAISAVSSIYATDALVSVAQLEEVRAKNTKEIADQAAAGK